MPVNKKELSRMYCVGGVEAFGKVYHVSCVCVCVDGQSVIDIGEWLNITHNNPVSTSFFYRMEP